MVAPARAKVDDAVRAALAAQGFRLKVPGRFTRPLSRACEAWVSVPLAERGEALDANPMLGVRHVAVEEMLQTCGLADEASGTAFRPLYEWLGTGYRFWEFGRSNVDKAAEQLAEAVEEAMPGVEVVASDEGVETALIAWAFADVRRLRLPALLLVNSDRERFEAQVREERAGLESGADAAVVREYDEQVERLRRMLR